MNHWNEKSIALHQKKQGKLAIRSKVPLKTIADLSLAYTPGVGAVASYVSQHKESLYDYTMKGNTVAIVSDGTAVLGLGPIGPEGALPVMEGKAILLKAFANFNAFPLCVNLKTVDEIVNFCKAIEVNFGAIMLEDIAAPDCVTIERRLQNELQVPVFHDDQHGTAIVVSAALFNVSKLLKKPLSELKVILSGTCAAGSSIARMLHAIGITSIVAYNKQGVVKQEKYHTYDFVIRELLDEGILESPSCNDFESLFEGRDVFIGVSAPGIVTQAMIAKMSPNPVIFAMANPTPEIDPLLAKQAHAFIVGTGRSDYPNQINNVLVFPGLMKGTLQAKAKQITMNMKIAAAKALANVIKEEELTPDYIIPSPFDHRISSFVAKAVKKACK